MRAGNASAPAYRRRVYGPAAHVLSTSSDGGMFGLSGRAVTAAKQAASGDVVEALG
ncbi:MAG: hypothetical protein ACUVS4_12945 [Chloroflexaceae bacterium]